MGEFSFVAKSKTEPDKFDIISRINNSIPEWAKVVKTRHGVDIKGKLYIHMTIIFSLEGKNLFQYKLSNDIPSRQEMVNAILERFDIGREYGITYKIKEV